MLKDTLTKIYAENELQIKHLMTALKHAPKGTIHCNKNGIYDRWYLSEKNQPRRYIKKKDRAVAEKLAYKKYIEGQLLDLKNEQASIKAFLSSAEKHPSITENYLSNPFYKDLLNSAISHEHISDASNDLQVWAGADFPTNPYHQDQLKYSCLSGHIVRSKSEVIIDQALFLHQIPFRYEAELTIGEFRFYPDFTIKHPRTGELFIWEHFGLIDRQGYARNAWEKIATLNAHGYHPSENFIMTFETKATPLDSAFVESLISYYFL